MFQKISRAILTVMVMVLNPKNEVLTVERVKSWQGITFPGGHLEPLESVLNAARREVLEETGIRIKDLKLKGLIHWFNRDNGEPYLVWCVTAREHSGDLKDSSEGKAAWLPLEALTQDPVSPGFSEQIRIFTDPLVFEAFATYGKDGDLELVFDDGGSSNL